MSPSVTFAASNASTRPMSSIYAPPQKKQKMSITQTYFLAHSARGKLSREAARPDHDLRLLVGHANMLDSLMVDLANAEQEQERWFNKSVAGIREEAEQPKIESIVEEPEADWEVEDAQSSDDEDYEEEHIRSTRIITSTQEVDITDDDESNSDLMLTRTQSHHSPPELTADSESDSEEDHMPPSPPNATFDSLSEKQRQAIATTSFYETKEASLSPAETESFEHEGFYLPSRPQSTIIAAY